MKQVPEMISTKDLAYLEDMFNWHFEISKKATNYKDLVSDEVISEFFVDVAKKHKKICEKIVKILEGGSNND